MVEDLEHAVAEQILFVLGAVEVRRLNTNHTIMYMKGGLNFFLFWIRDVFCTQHPLGRLGCKTHLKSQFLAPF